MDIFVINKWDNAVEIQTVDLLVTYPSARGFSRAL